MHSVHVLDKEVGRIMKQRSLIIFVVLIIGFLYSCGSQYTTPLRHDPLFKLKPFDNSVLEEGGEVYTQREGPFLDNGQLKVRPGEPYEQFQNRLFNTLVMQEYNKNHLAKAIEETGNSINLLQNQLSILQKENADLRLGLTQIKTGTVASSQAFSPMFSRYVVGSGDTLQKISLKKYGTYTGWLTLYRFNAQTLKYGPNKLIPGMSLIIPNVGKKF